MKKYFVTVNGKKFEVEVEEIASAGMPIKVEVEAPKKEVVEEKEVVMAGDNQTTVLAPMPGVIHSVPISEGQRIKKGDVLFILEAMKMENEIMAGEDGVVVRVLVQKGTQVNTDDVLAILQ